MEKKIIDSLKNYKRENLVFIGGDYDHMPPLRMIERFVKDAGFEPVIAIDFQEGAPELGDTHDVDIHQILGKCGHAIFEVTSAAGQLMELERCCDFKIIPIIVYAVRDESGITPPSALSTMITTMKCPSSYGPRKCDTYGYATIERLEVIIKGRLKAITYKP